MILRKLSSILILAVLALVVLPAAHAAGQTTPPEPDDLLDTVNERRDEAGLDAYRPNDALMEAAQAHAEYQASIGQFTHVGEDGSDETGRALAAGYGDGGIFSCDEAVAMGGVATEVDYIVNTVWASGANSIVVMSPEYVEAGVGVAEEEGLVYYTLVACFRAPTPTPTETGPARTPRPTNTLELAKPVDTVAAQEDGSIIHTVKSGEVLYTIALAYGVPVNDVAAMNGIDIDNPVIYEGQTLIIRLANTPTISPTVTETVRPPSVTPRLTATRRPPRPTRTGGGPTELPTARPILVETETASGNLTRRAVGLGILVVSGVGLLILIAGNLRKK